MRRRTRISVGVSLGSAVLALAALTPAFSETYPLTNGGFEAGPAGWSPAVGATLLIDGSTTPASGASAAHLTSTGAGTMSLSNKYWESPDATPLVTYTLSALLRDNEAATSVVSARLTVLSATEQVLAEVTGTLDAGNSASYRAVTTSGVVAPPGAKYLRVTFTAQASGAGAHLSVDSVSINAIPPAPTPTPTATPTATPTPPPPDTPAPPEEAPPPPIATTSPTPRPTVTPRVTPSPTPTPTPPPLPGRVLRNTGFDQGALGWSVTRGRLSVASVLDGQGPSLILIADDAATAWVQQTVAITPGGWFVASALLAPLERTEAAWVRIAWYASVDGDGAQLSTDDSPPVASPAPNSIVRAGGYEVVSTGPVQAPSEARSARVRVLLRAIDERGASIAIDDVSFGATDPAESTPPVATPVARVVPTATATPTPAGTPRPETRPSATPVATATSEGSPGDTTLAETRASAAAQRRLRITEIMSNPEEAGGDGEFEWIEVMNTGTTAAGLAGVSVRDRRSGNVLPPYVLDPGAVVVIAAPGARIPEGVPLIRLRRAIGNGLGNAGDRVALVATDGREIDAVAYGEGIEEGEAALPAPGPGQSLERFFSPTGALLDARLSDTPSPGVPPLPAATPDTEASESRGGPTSFGSLGGLAPAWAVLAGLAGGLLIAAAVARTASIVRKRDVEA